ncbi:MAG TPA: ATP-binding protein [Rubrobacter sp.]|nr:ATP-binding protein [Rubrobacter sp.]
MQGSDAGKVRGPRVPRITMTAALVCWAVGALIFAFLPQGSGAKAVISTTFSISAATFAAVVLLRAASHAQGHERAFLRLMGWGMVFRLAGNSIWSASHYVGLGILRPVAPQDVAYAISYPLLVGAMLHLVALATRRITLVSAMDAVAVMLSVGTLAWYFVLGPATAEAGLGSVREAVVALSQPVCDAALLFLGFVVASSPVRPRFSAFLNGGFVALLFADAAYLSLRSVGPYQIGNWPEMLWALGMILLGLTSTTSPEVPADPNVRWIQPWRILLFWLGPLSPPVQFAILLLWGAMNPPLPAYVLAGCAILLLYLAMRIGLVSFVSRRLGQEREESAREKEQSRLLYELHDTVKQNVHGISLTLRAALDTERRGEREEAREMFERALGASREAEFQISRPYDELQTLRSESPPRAGDFLRQRLHKFEEYFGVKTHDDLQASLEGLNPAEIAAFIRVFVEACWNVAKHSGAGNLYLESRQVGSLLIIRVRDDGRGFDTGDPPPGLGLGYMRRRAGEVGAGLDVISTPGRGTTVQIRFRNSKELAGRRPDDV